MNVKPQRKSALVNVGVPRDLHREMSDYVDTRGMKLRSLPAVLWAGFKLLTPEQISQAQQGASRYMARRQRRTKVPA